MSTANRTKNGASGVDRLREEYLEILTKEPLLGTACGGRVDQFGFPSAASIFEGISDAPAPRVSASRHLVQLRPVEVTAPKAAGPSPFETFAVMLEMGNHKAKPQRIVA